MTLHSTSIAWSKFPWPIGHTRYYSCCAAKQDENCKRNLHKNFLASLTSTTELLTHSVHVHLTYSITCSRLLAILKPATFQAIQSKKSNTLYMYYTNLQRDFPASQNFLRVVYLTCIVLYAGYLACIHSPGCSSSLKETKRGVWSATVRLRPRLFKKYFLITLPH